MRHVIPVLAFCFGGAICLGALNCMESCITQDVPAVAKPDVEKPSEPLPRGQKLQLTGWRYALMITCVIVCAVIFLAVGWSTSKDGGGFLSGFAGFFVSLVKMLIVGIPLLLVCFILRCNLGGVSGMGPDKYSLREWRTSIEEPDSYLYENHGACCSPEGCSSWETKEECESGLPNHPSGGEYQGDGTSCYENACGRTDLGACCFQSNCIPWRSRDYCEGESLDFDGSYCGDGTVCLEQVVGLATNDIIIDCEKR